MYVVVFVVASLVGSSFLGCWANIWQMHGMRSPRQIAAEHSAENGSNDHLKRRNCISRRTLFNSLALYHSAMQNWYILFVFCSRLALWIIVFCWKLLKFSPICCKQAYENSIVLPSKITNDWHFESDMFSNHVDKVF